MATIETVRLAPTASVRHREPDLLELLESGDPAAYAVDSRDRIVFWNSGAARIFGRRADEVIGRRCWDAVAGHDTCGERYCSSGCPATIAARCGGSRVFELKVQPRQGGGKRLMVTTLTIPGPRPDLYTLVHLLGEVEEPLPPAAPRPLAAPEPAPQPEERAEGVPAPVGGDTALTARERDVLGCIAAGLSNKEVAQQLGLSVATVRNHVHNTLEKLGVHSKLEAVALAFRSGWVKTN